MRNARRTLRLTRAPLQAATFSLAALLVAASACGEDNDDQAAIDAQERTITEQQAEISKLEDQIANTSELDAVADSLEVSNQDLSEAEDLIADLLGTIEALDGELSSLTDQKTTAELRLASEGEAFADERVALVALTLEAACESGTNGIILRPKAGYGELAAVAPQLASMKPNSTDFLFAVVEADLTVEYDRCALLAAAELEARFVAARANFEPTAVQSACDAVVGSLDEGDGRREVAGRIGSYDSEYLGIAFRRDEALWEVWSGFDQSQRTDLSDTLVTQIRNCIRNESGFMRLPIGSGTWDIGEEIASGTWRSESNPGGCYWARNDANGNIRANNFITGTGPVQIRVSSGDDNLEIQDCGTLTYVG